MSTSGNTEPEHNSGVIVVLNDEYFLIHYEALACHSQCLSTLANRVKEKKNTRKYVTMSL